MITGHLGVAGLLRSASSAKFSTRVFFALALASLSPDILDGLFVLARICSPYGLYTHTLYSVLLQAAVIGGAAFLVTDSRPIGALFATAVLLHLAGDLVTGQKILVPGGEMHGLYWYDHPTRDFALEVPIVVLGWYTARRAATTSSWMASVWVLLAAIVVQAAFDVTMHQRISRKPTACFRTMTPQY